MKYTIFSIDDRRSMYKDQIRRVLAPWEEVPTDCVNGYDPEQLAAAMKKHPYAVNWPAKVGHLGIWHTVLNAFEHGSIVTFEDDAVLGHMFHSHFRIRARQIPDDFDFFSLFIPRDSDHIWTPELSVNNVVTRVYQRYGGVSMYYSEQGIEKIKWLLNKHGFIGQYDDSLYAWAKDGSLNGYCSPPIIADLVFITGEEDSIVQESPMYQIGN